MWKSAASEGVHTHICFYWGIGTVIYQLLAWIALERIVCNMYNNLGIPSLMHFTLVRQDRKTGPSGAHLVFRSTPDYFRLRKERSTKEVIALRIKLAGSLYGNIPNPEGVTRQRDNLQHSRYMVLLDSRTSTNIIIPHGVVSDIFTSKKQSPNHLPRPVDGQGPPLPPQNPVNTPQMVPCRSACLL